MTIRAISTVCDVCQSKKKPVAIDSGKPELSLYHGLETLRTVYSVVTEINIDKSPETNPPPPDNRIVETRAEIMQITQRWVDGLLFDHTSF
ncbi:hypothetical protein RRG08_018338 [Elysia crispata]|uniref:Uncharacterized protein n=1 Tax=Elysia crispata TaxID=231223 RepID=A0AAE0XZU0_9GAST|nr:hypothetical protein RRG08_018338 [Elysia crispata]